MNKDKTDEISRLAFRARATLGHLHKDNSAELRAILERSATAQEDLSEACDLLDTAARSLERYGETVIASVIESFLREKFRRATLKSGDAL